MTALVLFAGAFLVAIGLCEVALGGRKLQSRLGPVVGIQTLVGAATVGYASAALAVCAPSGAIFWLGAFLTWFGVRSHVESSILLRMLYLLRRGGRTERELLSEYDAHYSGARRFDELVHAGLVERQATGPRLTARGRLVLRAVSWLT